MAGLRSIFRRLRRGDSPPPSTRTPKTLPPSPTPEAKAEIEAQWLEKRRQEYNFQLARRSDPTQPFAEEEVREWVAAKQQATAVCEDTSPVDEGQSGIYRKLRDPYEIRVLEVLPGVGDEMLRCRLVHCSVELDLKFPKPKVRFALSMDDLTQPVWYTALSYVWGPPVFEATIECDGRPLAITRTLETALRRFRLADSSTFMWVDQICINQTDLREKERQIPLMGQIYRHALNTAIWLGEGSADSDAAIDLLFKYGDQFRIITMEADPEHLSRELPPATDKIWSQVWDLLLGPWFTRVWVIQEFILSREPWLVCGQSVLPWKVLHLACENFVTSGVTRWVMPKLDRSDPGSKFDVFEARTDLSAMKHRYDSSENCSTEFRRQQMIIMPSLIDLLSTTRSVQCYDARDRIYALLGICEEEDRAIVEPSYAPECTAASQYHAMAVYYMTKSPRQSLLLAVDHEPTPGLPSWVPDWRIPRRTDSFAAKWTGWSYDAGARYSREDNRRVPRKFPYWPPVVKGKNREELCLPVLVVDTLVAMSDGFRDPYLNLVNPKTGNTSLLAALEFVLQNAGRITTGPTGLFDTFWRTLVANKDNPGVFNGSTALSGVTFAEIFSLLLDESTGKSPTLPGQTYSARQKLPKHKKDRLTLASLDTYPDWEVLGAARTALSSAMKNRRLGVTEAGRLGLFPLHSKVGDTACVMHIGTVPFLLRRADEQSGKYSLVGECYVHGIMGGEAVDQEKKRRGQVDDEAGWPGEILTLI